MGKFFKQTQTVYGWIKPETGFEKCGPVGHYEMLLPEWKSGNLGDYYKAYKAGWVRVSSHENDFDVFMEVFGTEESLDILEKKIIDLAYVVGATTTYWRTEKL